MTSEDSNANPWSLTSMQLAARIRQIAQADPATINKATRAEASLLAEEWDDALNLPKETFEAQEVRRSRLSALQRRSIEILVHAAGSQ